MTTANLTTSGATPALVATSLSANGAGTYIEAIRASTDGDRNVIVATNASSGGYPAIYARNTASVTTGNTYAIYGRTAGIKGQAVSGVSVGGGVGVYGSGGAGVAGYTTMANGNGVAAFGMEGAFAALYAPAQGAQYAGYFVGSIAKTGGYFLIDHPLDPENRYLRHSFVESSEMKNVYDGVVIADVNGEARVELPTYFEALNSDFRYQLTALGAAAPELHVSKELVGGSFHVSGARPGQRISWQVTGVRKDAWALANPMLVEEMKPANERGLYLHPEVYGQPASKALSFSRFNDHVTPPEAP